MKPSPIGILGGAGPLAGAALLDRILSLCGSAYGCYKDADFPKIILLSFPFSEMLTAEFDAAQIQNELRFCLDQLRKNEASILAIACNTLHAFLDENEDLADLVHLPRLLAAEIPIFDPPLVLCTSTSVRFGLHKRFFPCLYPDVETQQEVDRLIDQILRGANQQTILIELIKVIQAQNAGTIVLGCTELSLLAKRLPSGNKRVIDPLELMAENILKQSFGRS